MQISTMLTEMSADIKNLRFAFPVETRVSTFEGGLLQACFEMANLHLGEVQVRQGGPAGNRKLFVEIVHSSPQSMTVTQARIQQHVMNEVLALAGFFEAQL